MSKEDRGIETDGSKEGQRGSDRQVMLKAETDRSKEGQRGKDILVMPYGAKTGMSKEGQRGRDGTEADLRKFE